MNVEATSDWLLWKLLYNSTIDFMAGMINPLNKTVLSQIKQPQRRPNERNDWKMDAFIKEIN